MKIDPEEYTIKPEDDEQTVEAKRRLAAHVRDLETTNQSEGVADYEDQPTAGMDIINQRLANY